MCFSLLALNQSREFPFILAANRDEYRTRPTQTLHQWHDHIDLIGGRDSVSLGSWLLLNKHTRRIALVTNYRQGTPEKSQRSRGTLVTQAALCTQPLAQCLTQLQQIKGEYAGFNLITGELPSKLYYISHRDDHRAEHIPDGIHALSNAYLNSPWMKVTRGKTALQQLLRSPHTTHSLSTGLFEILSDTTPATDADLPDTGIGLEKERWLSSIFIQGKHYGTRSTSLILMNTAGILHFFERTHYSEQAPVTHYQQF